MLATAEEINDFKIQIIQHLDLRGLLVKKYLGATGECFNVGLMFGQQGNDLFSQTILATDVCEGADHEGMVTNKGRDVRSGRIGQCRPHRFLDGLDYRY